MIDEKSLLEEVKKYLEKARPGDLDHTLRVVELIKELLKTEKSDPDILIPAAYLHDVGQSGLFEEGEKVDTKINQDKLKEHMRKGALISKEILTKLNYPKESIEKISWIISVHDNWYTEDDYEVGILMDADNLSKLDIIDIKRKYKNPKEKIEMWEKDMPKRLKTKTGKLMYKELMEKLKKELL
jgi:uncharacterized protein